MLSCSYLVRRLWKTMFQGVVQHKHSREQKRILWGGDKKHVPPPMDRALSMFPPQLGNLGLGRQEVQKCSKLFINGSISLPICLHMKAWQKEHLKFKKKVPQGPLVITKRPLRKYLSFFGTPQGKTPLTKKDTPAKWMCWTVLPKIYS